MTPTSTDHGKISTAGGEVVPYEDVAVPQGEIEEYTEAERQGPSEQWLFWSEEVMAALKGEERFRKEGDEAETAFFGDESKTFTTEEYKKEQNKTNIIHANIQVLKPLLFSEVPEPMVRRRFGGDGEQKDPTDRVAATVAQRLAQYLVDTTRYEEAMELCRDDWLIPGRAVARVMYTAEFSTMPMMDPATNLPMMDATGAIVMQEVKSSEGLRVRHWPWRRCMFSAANTWDEVRWTGFETFMTKKQVARRFGEEKAEAMSYPINGLKGEAGSAYSDQMTGYETDTTKETSGTKSVTAHDQCVVVEIWDKDSRKCIWWSPHYRDDVLDAADDPLHLEEFFNCTRPLLAVTKNGMLNPRPDTAFYKARADEIDLATKKLNSILEAMSVSGLYPGKMVEEMKKLLDGKSNKMIPIEEWVGFIEKGGTQGIIQWLPLDQFVIAAQALVQMREQAKQALFEISGISDIVRGQTDPGETLGAQQLKGNYANIRLRDKQRRMNIFARDTIRLMVEIALEHFDTKTIADIVALDMPMTDADLERMNAMIEQGRQQHAMQTQLAQATGQPPPPPPTVPFFEQTSYERVHNVLRHDMTRKFSLSIETDATILADAEEDKKQRVEFLQAFAAMSESLFPMAQSGIVEMKVVKELLLFAVRGFPKSRTLEGMLQALPDTINTEPKEDTAVTVAKIRAEVDMAIAKMETAAKIAEGEANRANDLKMKGVDLLAQEITEANKPPPKPAR